MLMGVVSFHIDVAKVLEEQSFENRMLNYIKNWPAGIRSDLSGRSGRPRLSLMATVRTGWAACRTRARRAPVERICWGAGVD